MANTRSAIKRMKQSEKRRVRNRAIRSRVRTAVKTARAAVDGRPAEGQSTDVAALVRDAIRTLDRAVSKGIVHRNTAARKKSALTKKLGSR